MKIPTIALLALASASFANYVPVPIEQGTKAPAFELPGIDGKNHTLDDIRGDKATAVIFTTNHCPDAIASIDRMIALVDRFQEKGVGFVAINSNSPEGLHRAELGWTVYDDSFEDMKLIAEAKNFNLPYLYDGETQATAKAYGAVATPHIFIFDAELQLKYNGRIDDGKRRLGPAGKNEARDALTAILAGKEPETTRTRPVGCTTKWKEKAGNVAKEDAKWKANPVTVETADAETFAKLVANKDRKTMRLFNIWSTSCGPCVTEFPELVGIFRQYHWQGFELITVSLDDPGDIEKVSDFLEGMSCGLPAKTGRQVKKDGRTTNNYIFDGDTEDLAKSLDPEWNGAMPHTILVGEDGKLLYRHTGIIEPLELKKVIVDEIWRVSQQ